MFNEKELVKNTFDKAANKFDEIGPPMFKYFGEILADFADILPADQVLDIGCGKGASTFPIAKKLDQAGKITGIDISPLMIKECKSLVPENLNERIILKVMDAENLEFSDSTFDIVVSSFGLFFLTDIKKGLDEIRRALKPGGLLVFSTWNNEYQLPWLKEILAKYIPDLNILKNSKANGINESDFSTLLGIEKILKTCTFTKKEIKTENMNCYYSSGDEWIETRWHTAYRMFFEKMEPEIYNSARNEIFEKLNDYKVDGRIKITMSAFLTKAVKSD